MARICRATHRITVLVSMLAILCGIAGSRSSRGQYGILRSTDNGSTWKQVFHGNFDVDHLVIDRGGYILASTMIVTSHKMFSELYASRLDTDVWRRIVLPGDASRSELIFDLIATPDGSVFALLKGTILRTDDGGVTWSIVASTLPADFTSLKVGPNHSLLAISKDGLYQSADVGKSWHSLGFEDQMPDGGTTLSDGTILVTSSCKLFATSLSQDHASEWFLPREDDCPNVRELASDARGHLFANTRRGIFRSVVTGKTWKKVLGFKEEVIPFGITVAPDGDVFALVLEGDSSPTLFRSIDAGETWLAVRRFGSGTSISQFAFASNGVVYAALTSFGD